MKLLSVLIILIILINIALGYTVMVISYEAIFKKTMFSAVVKYFSPTSKKPVHRKPYVNMTRRKSGLDSSY
ncbi:hypothetical protein NEPAR06_0317 [Nematocida parisii]|uniref:Uncharacterized protein n=1 Tax=Nematocida parisii (strain ERTm3) TaxID=935791 RepID=I3EGA6_NEMP3|nr:uncharacterized protein NEPG_01253 [Nematocida parisii ERTm1]EIJ88253.1 hypothetical protein NEQG_01697 [Nematocida parisii ERTm3]KAI5125328.1 hypothetical protein NEPAR03_0003 [Nematocida parisii]EIJ93681.1 hypothetical protein NEPG_01253 [Nematocida parisii ERTm1]KAI5125452.1 hypothetical protein NEPAR08_0003 [Nematocida parisii]KAI5140585.1 hypothetical protein NEPAR04_0326 [Nematocida parisii]|eukprot:XP_013059081.1 hypothetical protein NEPG_01253 [Nematocida parisii ERTm1]